MAAAVASGGPYWVPSHGGPSGGPPLWGLYPIDRDRVTTARRLHECLLLQPTQLKALRVCVLGALSQRWAWGPPDPVGEPTGPAAAGGPLGAPQWALQQRENFPAGYQVLLEERASCAAASLWNAMRDTQERALQGLLHGAPITQGAASEGGPQTTSPTHGLTYPYGGPRDGHEGAPPLRSPIKGGPPGGPQVGLVFCSAALLPLLVESLQQLHAMEAPKAAAAEATAAAAAAAGDGYYRTSFASLLHRSPPCLLPLLLLRFLVLPAAAAYAIAAAAAALSSWARNSLQRGDPPAAAAGELHVPIDGAPGRGPPR